MANVKITDLSELTVPESSDVLAVVDVSVNTTKKITGANLTKALSAATTAEAGIVQLSDSTSSASSVTAATSAAAKAVQDFAQSVKLVADAALPKAGGTMTGAITFAGGQSFPGALPTAGGAMTGAITFAGGQSFPGTALAANILYNRRPAMHRGSLFFKTAATTISIVAGAVLNGQLYSTATAVTMPGSFTNNTDYAIWQNPGTGALVGDASFTTAPAGATGGSIVGGFHYIPSGRPTAVNSGSPTTTAEILEYSIWDLTWRPECPDPRGMSCIDGRFWIDIYLCSNQSYAGTTFSSLPGSRLGWAIATLASPPRIPAFYGGDGTTSYADVSGTGTLYKACWYDFCEVATSFGKRLPSMSEFQAAAFGAPEGASKGTAPANTAWERASKWGLAQATGSQWVWGADLLFRDVSSQTFDWRTLATRSRGNVEQQGSADSLVAVVLGGSWNTGTNSGSRASSWSTQPWMASGNISARFVAGHIVSG
jgi:hypothetical protein